MEANSNTLEHYKNITEELILKINKLSLVSIEKIHNGLSNKSQDSLNNSELEVYEIISKFTVEELEAIKPIIYTHFNINPDELASSGSSASSDKQATKALYDIVLTKVNAAKKMDTIKLIKTITQLELKESKDIYDKCVAGEQLTLLTGIDKSDSKSAEIISQIASVEAEIKFVEQK